LLPRPDKNLLILGGTGEGVELSTQLLEIGKWRITYSLAGATRKPRLPDADIRTGGFGGPDGLRAYLISSKIDAVVDLTHPYATEISASAYQASKVCGITCIRYDRPPWVQMPGDQWHVVQNSDQAVSAIPHGTRVLLTIGSKNYDRFLSRGDVIYFIRVIEAPQKSIYSSRKDYGVLLQAQSDYSRMSEKVRFIIARPPFSVEQEMTLLKDHNIQYVVTKNSGGRVAYSKLDAARRIGIPVILIDRPKTVPKSTGQAEHKHFYCFDNLPDVVNQLTKSD